MSSRLPVDESPSPTDDNDMDYNADEVVEIFQCAAEENLISPMRNQQVVHLENSKMFSLL
jgi:hypothetical protein